jgi:hypothetical protein
MKKNEDLKRHSGGEKTALKTGTWINISLFLFLILSKITFSQIPINGFCVQNSYQVPAGYEKIVTADLNNDQSDEFVLYSSTIKKIGILSIRKDGTHNFKEHPVAFGFSQIKYLKDSNRFICVSRKNRLIASYEFNLSATPKMISKITFNSYPENIFDADINGDGKLEVLVSGIGFDGLSVLFREKDRLAERKIFIGESFSHAVFSDLSNDGYSDIAAFNIINNSVQFFYNDTKSKFNLERGTESADQIELLNSSDFDKDGFPDLVFAQGMNLNITYGDFQSAYEKKIAIPLKNNPDAIQLGDYNNDEITDIAYINYETGNVNVLFGKSRRDFYNEITYTTLSSVSCLVSYKEKKKDNLILLSKDGFVTTISSFKTDFKQVCILPAVSANTIQKFDLGNNGISDISFIDDSDNSFRIITRDNNGLPSFYYAYQLAESHQSVVADDFYSTEKTFYCYSKENQLIEFLRFNFETNELNHKQIYSPGKIKDLAIQRVDSSLINIYLLYEKSSILYLGRFEHRDLSLTFKEFPFLARDVICAELFLDKDVRAYYWKETSDSLFLNEVVIKTGPNDYRGIVGLSKQDSINISLFASNQLYKGKPWLLSSVQNEAEKFLVSFKEKNYKILHTLGEEIDFGNFNDEQVLFSELQNGESEKFLIYLPDSKTLNKLQILKDGKSYSLKLILDAVDINNYFIDKFNSKKYHLVYSNKEKGCISLVPLKKK